MPTVLRRKHTALAPNTAQSFPRAPSKPICELSTRPVLNPEAGCELLPHRLLCSRPTAPHLPGHCGVTAVPRPAHLCCGLLGQRLLPAPAQRWDSTLSHTRLWSAQQLRPYLPELEGRVSPVKWPMLSVAHRVHSVAHTLELLTPEPQRQPFPPPLTAAQPQARHPAPWASTRCRCASLEGLQRSGGFYTLKVCGDPAPSKSIGTISLQYLLISCLCVTFGQLSQFFKLPSLGCLVWWFVISDLRYYYCNCLGAP